MEVYVTRDGSEACLSLNPPNAFCTRDGVARETRLELVFNRCEVYVGEMREVYRPKGLLAFTIAAKEYVRLLIPALWTPALGALAEGHRTASDAV
jgi:hypothetical protein